MNGDLVLAAVLFAMISTVSPGGATTLATASGSRFGLRRSLPLLGGMAVGLAALAATAALGLAGLMLAAPVLQLLTKVAGSAYLLWLAAGIARGERPGATTIERPRRFVAGVLLLWLNPKGWAMTLAAAASFGGAGASPVLSGLLLGTTFGLASTVSLVLWCCTGMVLARVIRTSTGWRRLNIMLAGLLVASAVPIWL